ncbi:hypothetical protein ACFQX7_37545 [Luedemannella flava]
MDPSEGDRGGLRLDPVALARAARRLLDATPALDATASGGTVPDPAAFGAGPTAAALATAAAGAGAALDGLFDAVADALVVDADRLLAVGTATEDADGRAQSRLAGLR